MIYADYSATSINKPQQMINAVICSLERSFGNPSRGSNRLALDALRALDAARKTVADFFHLQKYTNLAFTPGGTYSLNAAIKGIIQESSHVISTVWEHNSVLRPLYQLQQKSVEISFIPVNEAGLLDTNCCENLLRDNTKAIIVNCMSNVTGNIADIPFFKSFAKKHNLALILDASQAAGACPLPLSEDDSNILLAITGHKSLYGPRGIGSLLSFGIDKLSPLITGGSGVHSFNKVHPDYFPDVCEAGTVNLPGAIGLAASLDWLSSRDRNADFLHLKTLRQHFYREAKKINGIRLYGSAENGGAIISLNIKNIPSSEVSFILEDEYDILTRAGAHCAPLLHEAFGTMEQGMVRFSFGLASSKEEVDICLNALDKIAANKNY